MAKRISKIVTFSDRMDAYAKEVLSDAQKVLVKKKKYLLKNKVEILKAQEIGYTYVQIAEVATIDLLESDIVKQFTWKNKDGIEMDGETKIYPVEIKELCES